MATVTVAILGAGFEGSNLALGIQRTPGIRVKHVVDSHPGRAADLAARVDATPLPDWSAAAAQSDVAVIATPNDQHLEPALAVLAMGGRVFVEKPATFGRPGIEHLRPHAEQGRLIVGHSLRTAPGIRRLVDEVSAGAIGTLHHLDAARTRSAAPGAGWKHDPSRSGGELYHEIHELDLLCLLGGDVCEVHSVFGPALPTPPPGADEPSVPVVDWSMWRLTSLTFASGAAARHQLDRRSHMPRWAMVASGTTGTLCADLRRGRIELHRNGAIADSWPVFDSVDANESLIAAATATSAFNRTGAAPSRWMQQLARHVAEEIRRFALGVPTVLAPRPLDALFVAEAALRTGRTG